MMQPGEDWDDTFIMKAFHNAIDSHRKHGEPPKVKSAPENVVKGPKNGNLNGSNGAKRKRENEVETAESNNTSKKGVKNLIAEYYTSRTRQDLMGNPGNIQTNRGSSVAFDLPEDQYNNTNPAPSPLHYTATEQMMQQTISSTGNPVVDDALQTMLMAWYQCGYATARYQTMMDMGYGYYPPTITSSNNDNQQQGSSSNSEDHTAQKSSSL